jgi:hypothetical protein
VATNYGTDFFLGATGINPGFPLVSGKATVAYNLFRRWTTNERLPAFKGNSIDLLDLVREQVTESLLPGREKDMIRVAVFEPRISSVFPKLTIDRKRETLKADARGVLVEGEEFGLVIDISLVSAAVVGIAVL